MASGRDDELIIDAEERLGEGGFLVLRRYRLRNRRPDGSASKPYGCDFIDRPFGLDAVAVALFRRHGGAVEVLLRTALRPPIRLGRGGSIPVPERGGGARLHEVVAGLIEAGDRGLEGVRRRAAIEVAEEVGYSVEPEAILVLGASTFPLAGALPERLYFTAVEIDPGAVAREPEGDGSPMEEGAEISWRPLPAAIAACVSGEIEDAKTEICLRRLAESLAA
jgi:ADP-ribose pyrophosphatase